MFLLTLYVVLAIGVSFLCSIMEAVLLSVTPAHIATMEQRNRPAASRVRRFKENIDEPLAAILSLNTIAHTAGAVGAGAQAARIFGDAWVGLFSAVLTLAILFLSEIIPKTIGAVYWKQLTPSVTLMLAWVMVPLKPLVWLSGLASRSISSAHEPFHVSRDEISALADLGARVGVLDEGESRIVKALLRFRSLCATDIMTPRTVVFALPADQTAGRAVSENERIPFSRIPIHEGSIDATVGFVLKDEVLERVARGDTDLFLRDLRRDIQVVPATARLPQLFDKFLSTREFIAAVIDEYGGLAGIVTLEDLVETVLDLEIVDEIDSVEDLRAAARQDWERRTRGLLR